MRVVVALGGNALLKRGEPLTAENQRKNVLEAVDVLADLAAAGHELIITHGNGPQVGLLALQGAAYRPDEAFPLDVLGAETQGMIGYMIELELENALNHHVPVVSVLTQIRVDPSDPAFQAPSKFVGPVYASEEEARDVAKAKRWNIAQDGSGWRRVVPSPKPMEIIDLKVLKVLLENEVIIICAGGGGIPVVRGTDGDLMGVEAVIDKDHASALLADQIAANALLLLTDVDGVYTGFGTPDAKRIEVLRAPEVADLALPKGSMAPKVAACLRFAQRPNRISAIGTLKDALKLIDGSAGTQVVA